MRLGAAGVVVALLACATAYLLLRDDGTPAPSPEQARALAAETCARMQQVEALVERNASVTDVREALRAAERSARRAASGDPAWLALSGGVSSVGIALESDDERSARTGIDVVRTECRRIG